MYLKVYQNQPNIINLITNNNITSSIINKVNVIAFFHGTIEQKIYKKI